MSDFSHGVAPQRYPCKRARDTLDTNSTYCIRKQSNQLIDHSRRAIHWSLDEGRWIIIEADNKDKKGEGGASRENNPSYSFKRLVEKGLDTFNLSKRRREYNEAQRQCKQAEHLRWTGQCSDPDALPTGLRSDAVKTATSVLKIADLIAYDLQVSLRKTELLFQDQENEDSSAISQDRWLAAGGAWYFLPEVGDRLPSAAALCRPPAAPPPRWLSILWFKQSPYSPIQVEAIDGLPGPPERWRNAFEDLMAASLGRPMIGLERTQDITRRNGHPIRPAGIDWVLSLQLRHILPPLLPSLYSPQRTRHVETNMVGRRRRHDYQEFSEFVDEIWKANRTLSSLCYIRELNQVFSKYSDRNEAQFYGLI